MQARMKNPATIVPGAMEAIQSLISATQGVGVPSTTLNLVHLRASQINGCHVCVDSGTCYAQQAGESDDRLFSVASWRKASCFSDAERAALALTEAVNGSAIRRILPTTSGTRRPALRRTRFAALILSIAMTNVFNRLNVTTKQVAGTW
jgi:AhpD family alkylhydroperoxidase